MVATPRLTNPDPTAMKWKATPRPADRDRRRFRLTLFLVERNAPNTADAAREAQNVVNFSREKINEITIQNGDDKIDIRQVMTISGGWRHRSKTRPTLRR